MAKRKTPKVKDLKVKADKLEEKELQDLQSLLKNIDMLHLNIGRTRSAEHETKKHSLLHQITGVQEQIGLLQKDFQESYGDVDINITDGTIQYQEDEQANKKD